MKKSIILILVLLLTINLVGCNSNNNFKYEIREEYQGKIREGLAEAFIDFTKDTERAYKELQSNKKIVEGKLVDLEEIFDLGDYMYSATKDYRKHLIDINPYEDKVLEIMEEQAWSAVSIGLERLSYDIKSEGYETKEDLEEKLEEIKSDIEHQFEQVKIYMK